MLAPVLVLGRGLQLVMGYLLGLLLDLPPEFLSLASVAVGFPGLILMCVVIPALVMAVQRNGSRLKEANTSTTWPTAGTTSTKPIGSVPCWPTACAEWQSIPVNK